MVHRELPDLGLTAPVAFLFFLPLAYVYPPPSPRRLARH